MLTPQEETIATVKPASQNGILAGDWTMVSPNPGLRPKFAIDTEAGAVQALSLRGNGSERCFGFARCLVTLEPGKSYRLSVQFTTRSLQRPEQQLVHGIYGAGFTAGVQEFLLDRGVYSGEEIFTVPEGVLEAELRLYFRYSATGSVNWHEVRLEPCAPREPRVVKIICRQGGMPPGCTLDFWDMWLDRAGAMQPDVVLLPEVFDGSTPETPTAPDGPVAALLRAKAAQWRMYLCGAYYERRDGMVYNTAPLYDRSGRLLGQYDKIMPYDPELDAGVVPGHAQCVYSTDFGRIAILTCYDSFFPETFRDVVAQGAELVLLPNYGYWRELMPVRAADNGVAIAVSSLQFPAGVWDSSGSTTGETLVDISRLSPTAIVSGSLDVKDGLLAAQVDLSRKYSPHWKGGPMRCAPAARPHRQTGVRPVLDPSAVPPRLP